MRGLFILTIVLLFASCSGGGNDIEPSLAFEETELKLVSEDTDTLIVESSGIESLLWETDNDFSITVNENGIVKANRIGETVVSVRDSGSELQAKCNITVYPKYNLYEEPILSFGKSQEEVKTLIDYYLAKETEVMLTYTHPDEKIVMMKCTFDNNKLVSISLMLKLTPKERIEIPKFLSERYKKISQEGVEGSEAVSYSFINKQGDMSVTYVEESEKIGFTITYAPIEQAE